MSLYSDTVKPERLGTLRGGLTTKEMAEKLNELIGYEGKYANEGGGLGLNGKSGAQTISHLENGRRQITPEIALAYAEIFDVSLDYIYGRIDFKNHEDKFIKEGLGISENVMDAVKILIRRIQEVESRNFKYTKKKSL